MFRILKAGIGFAAAGLGVLVVDLATDGQGSQGVLGWASLILLGTGAILAGSVVVVGAYRRLRYYVRRR